MNEEGSRKDVKKAKEQLDRTLEKYQTLFQLKSPVEDAYLENLNEEKKLLGAYITSNPLQQYEYLKEKPGIGSLSQIAPQGNYIGVITNLEVYLFFQYIFLVRKISLRRLRHTGTGSL